MNATVRTSRNRIGEFLARSAASGIQVILESHSDHVLNGVRRAIKKQIISHEEVAIHFFTLPNKQSDHAPVISPLIDKNGNLDQCPADFFDQFDKDMAFLLGWEG
jgi:predicted ATPase